MKKITTLLSILGSTALLNAGPSHHYISAVAGTLDFDQRIYGVEYDEDDKEKLISYDEAKVIGIDYTFLKEISNSSVLIGVRPQLLLNEGDFFDGGFLNINLLLGAGFGDFKLYGNAGYGLNSLSEYTVSGGLNYGLTARYDITNHFSASLSYNIYDMKVADPEDYNPTKNYKADGILANLSLKF